MIPVIVFKSEHLGISRHLLVQTASFCPGTVRIHTPLSWSIEAMWGSVCLYLCPPEFVLEWTGLE